MSKGSAVPSLEIERRRSDLGSPGWRPKKLVASDELSVT
jgi:hypothetical protein